MGSGAIAAIEKRKHFMFHVYEAILQHCPGRSVIEYKQLSDLEQSSSTEQQQENQSSYYWRYNSIYFYILAYDTLSLLIMSLRRHNTIL